VIKNSDGKKFADGGYFRVHQSAFSNLRMEFLVVWIKQPKQKSECFSVIEDMDVNLEILKSIPPFRINPAKTTSENLSYIEDMDTDESETMSHNSSKPIIPNSNSTTTFESVKNN